MCTHAHTKCRPHTPVSTVTPTLRGCFVLFFSSTYVSGPNDMTGKAGLPIPWVRLQDLVKPYEGITCWENLSRHRDKARANVILHHQGCRLQFKLLCLHFHFCPSWKRDASFSCSSSEVYHFFPPLKVFFRELLFIQIEGLWVEGVLCCTDSKAPWGLWNVGCINNWKCERAVWIKFTWLPQYSESDDSVAFCWR